MANHVRNTGPMLAAKRCGAKTRKGTPCAAPAISGKKRCRKHGGKNPGAPKGNRNAWKHGFHSQEVREIQRDRAEFLASIASLFEDEGD